MFAYTKLMQAMAAAGVVSATDPYFNLTTLLLPGNGTNGAQNNTFLDSSSNNFTITRNGNTTQGTFSPFSQTGWSNYFSGTSDYLYAPSNAAFGFSGSWSVEGMVYFTGTPSQNYPTGDYADYIIDFRSGDTTNAFMGVAKNGSGNLVLWGGWNGTENLGTNTLALNTWYYVAFVYNGSTFRGYVNGVQEFSQTITRTTGTNSPTIGARYSRSEGYLTGYLSNLRVVTSAVTPSTPTSPLTAISGTVLLTCQSNRFIDNSSNAFAITVGGTPSVQPFSPFLTNVAYTPTNQGGSGYFDGNGDYLSVPNNAAFNFGTGDFTIEAWAYFNSTADTNSQGVCVVSGTSAAYPVLYISTNGGTTLTFANNSSGVVSGTITKFAWNHIVVTRSGSTVRMFINGTQASSATYTSSVDFNGVYTGVQSSGAGGFMNGYLSGVRLLKGTGYTTFPIPTTPPTNITNTSLLLNFTNAGITDATAKNDLETVADAQISTTQSKWGGSSIYFDGTGDALVKPSTVLFNPYAGNFTLELWVYHTTSAGSLNMYFAHNTGGLSFYRNTGGKLELAKDGVAALATSTNNIPINQWVHVAASRSGTSLKLFINGAQEASVVDSTNIAGTGPVGIGNTAAGTAYPLTGYIDDMRLTIGYARYTAAFTAPTAAFPVQ